MRSGTVLSFISTRGLSKTVEYLRPVFYNTQVVLKLKNTRFFCRSFDRDGSGTIEGQELSIALAQQGYNLPPEIIDLVEYKYGTAWRIFPCFFAGG